MDQLCFFVHPIEIEAAKFLGRPPSHKPFCADGTAIKALLNNSHHHLTVMSAINEQISIEQMVRMLHERKGQLERYNKTWKHR